MDAAVKFVLKDQEPKPGLVLDPNPDVSGAAPVQDELVCGYADDYDMGSELRTGPDWVKCDQPYLRIRHRPHYNDEESATSTYGDVAKGINIYRCMADDWLGERKTPVTTAVWLGSYIGYGYKECQYKQQKLQPMPDHFLLSV